MPSERLIERSFSHSAVLAEHNTIECKLRWAYSNFWGQPNNGTFVGTNTDLVERLLKQPIILQRKIKKKLLHTTELKRGGDVALLASKEYDLATIKTTANNTRLDGKLRFKKSVFCSNHCALSSTNWYINIPKFSWSISLSWDQKTIKFYAGTSIISQKMIWKNRKFSEENRLPKPIPKIKEKRAHKSTDQKQLNSRIFLKFWMWNRGSENKSVSPLWSLFESDLNDNQNNAIEDEQEKQKNWNPLNRLSNVLELNLELSKQLRSKDDFFGYAQWRKEFAISRK